MKLKIIEDLRDKTEEMVLQQDDVQELPQMRTVKVESELGFELKEHREGEETLVEKTIKMQTVLQDLVESMKNFEDDLKLLLPRLEKKTDLSRNTVSKVSKQEDAPSLLGNEMMSNHEIGNTLSPLQLLRKKAQNSSRANSYRLGSLTSLYSILNLRKKASQNEQAKSGSGNNNPNHSNTSINQK